MPLFLAPNILSFGGSLSLSTRVRKCVGIELVHARARQAPESQREGTRLLAFHCGDFTTFDCCDATVLFTNSVAFSQATLRMLATKAAGCASLRAFVSMKRLEEPLPAHLELSHSRDVEASWGPSQFCVYTVVAPPAEQ